MRTFILIAAALAAIAGVSPAQARTKTLPPSDAVKKATGKKVSLKIEATPALWKIKGAHGTVYLFGTLSEMKKEVHWENKTIRDAFSNSRTVYFPVAELSVAGQRANLQKMLQLGIDEEHPLSTKISQQDIDMLDAAAIKTGLNHGEDSFEQMKPWLVYMLLIVDSATRAGYRAEFGVESTLYRQALAAKKTIKGFESLEQTQHLLVDTPEAEQVEVLHNALVNKADSAEQINQSIAYWTHGDVAKVAALENAEVLPDSKLYDRWVVTLNRHCANQIASLLKSAQPGDVFLAVGASQLAGPGNILSLLQKRGITVTRVE